MKSNSTIKISGLKLFPWQSDFRNEMKDIRGSSKRITVLSGRQIGKSTSLLLELIEFSLEKTSTIIYLTPTNNLARKCFKDLVKRCIKTGLIKSANSTTLEVEWINGSIIYFRSSEMREALRGFTVDLLIIDEAAFINDDIFEICLPMCNVRNAPIILVSTPRFRSGFFYDYYQRGMNGVKNYISLTWSNYDTSALLKPELKEEYRLTMSKNKFKNEILGEFVDTDGTLFTNLDNCLLNEAVDDSKLYIGIDWATGSGNDYTCVTAINQEGKMVFIKYFNDRTPTQQVAIITKILQEYKTKIVKVQVEYNSIGSVFYDLLIKNNPGLPIIKFNTTNKSKNTLVNKLQTALENQKIGLIRDDKLLNELRLYEADYNHKTGTITYNAPSGYNDDTVISLMLAFDALNTNKGTYNIKIR